MAGWLSCFLLLGVLLLTTIVSGQPDKPLFGFAGQSNMIGHNTEGQSSDRTQYQAIIDILADESLNEEQKKVALKEKFDQAAEGTIYPDVSPFLAEEMIKLYNRRLFDGIENELDYATCSFIDPGHAGTFPAVPVWPYSGCGFSFGW